MAVEEPNQKHYIVDNTYRGETINSDTVIAGVIYAKTGPCEETVVNSESQFCDLFLNSDSISAEDDTTLQHAVKLLQFSPLHVVRATNDKVKEGITNNGGTIFTDSNYSPYKYSKTFKVEDPVAENYGFLGFTTEDGAYVAKFNDEPIKNAEFEKTVKERFPGLDTYSYTNFDAPTGSSFSGIDPVFEQVNATHANGLPNSVGFDFTNANYHVVYTLPGTAFSMYPGTIGKDWDSKWIYEIKKQDISSNVYKVDFKDTTSSEGVITEGVDYVNINGYSFYLGVQTETTEITVPGEGVEININREEDSTVSPNVFGLYVFDELVTNTKYKSPIISQVDSSFSFTLTAGENMTILSNMDDLIDIYVDDTKKEADAGELGNDIYKYTVSATTKNRTIKVVPCCAANTVISDERFFYINFSKNANSWLGVEKKTYSTQGSKLVPVDGVTTTPSGNFNDHNVEIKIPSSVVKANCLNSQKTVTLKIYNGNKEVASATTDVTSGDLQFKNWAGTEIQTVSAILTNNADTAYPYKLNILNFDNAGKFNPTKVDGQVTALPEYYAVIEFYNIEFDANVDNVYDNRTYALYVNATSSRPYEKSTVAVGKVSVPMAVFKMGVALNSFFEGFKDGDVHPFERPAEDSPFYSVGGVTLYNLKSKWRSAASNTANIEVTNAGSGFTQTLLSRDYVNKTQQKNNYFLKIDNITFWNGKKGSYETSSESEDAYQLGFSAMTFKDFIAAVLEELPSFWAVYPTIAEGNEITFFSNSEITTSLKLGYVGSKIYIQNPENLDQKIALDELDIESTDSRSYEFELASRFAIVAAYPSNTKNFGFTLSQRADETWDISIRRKSNTITTHVSFTEGVVDGYGTDIYFTRANNDTHYKLIELNKDGLVEEVGDEISFGDKIPIVAPGLTQRKNALSKLTLDTGYYYNYITEFGYTNASFDVYATSIATSLNSQYIFTAPKTYLSTKEIIEYRDASGLDSRNAAMFVPWYKDNSLGSFVCELSPSVQVLQRLLANKALYKEFAPVFGPVNGEVNVSTRQSSSTGLLVDFNNVEDRETLLARQINPLKNDKGLGIVYIDDSWTTQKKDSHLSDFNNVYMTNVIQHVLDTFMKEYFAKFNNAATRANVVSVLTSAFNDRIFANQQFVPKELVVICDSDNNPDSVVLDRKLVVDVRVAYEVGIKYIQTYTRVEIATEY